MFQPPKTEEGQLQGRYVTGIIALSEIQQYYKPNQPLNLNLSEISFS